MVIIIGHMKDLEKGMKRQVTEGGVHNVLYLDCAVTWVIYLLKAIELHTLKAHFTVCKIPQ